jgi:hypothetical protein
MGKQQSQTSSRVFQVFIIRQRVTVSLQLAGCHSIASTGPSTFQGSLSVGDIPNRMVMISVGASHAP